MSTVQEAGSLTGPYGRPGRAPATDSRVGCAAPVTAAAVSRLRRLARDTTREWQLPDSAEEAACVIVTELVTNVLLHSGSPDVTLSMVRDDCALTIEVADSGRWRPRRTPRRAPQDAGATCGRGLPLVDAYAVSCEVLTTASGTRVRAEVAVPAPAGVLERTGPHLPPLR
ncbi:ATP-binding protein [Streptomyces sp. NPDC101393]|uniref:ATP-binding protein n=1 Tax=Streptomyces sp. NPDC101393 TaxID=3366141 RepID=UPI00381D397D